MNKPNNDEATHTYFERVGSCDRRQSLNKNYSSSIDLPCTLIDAYT